MDADVEPENLTVSATTASSWDTVDLQRNVYLRQDACSTSVVPPLASEDSPGTVAPIPPGDHDGESSSRRDHGGTTYSSRSECGLTMFGNVNVNNITINHYAERDRLETLVVQRHSDEDVGTQNREQYGVPSGTHINTQGAGFAGQLSLSIAAQHTPSPDDVDQEQTSPKQQARVAGLQTTKSEDHPMQGQDDCPQSSNGETFSIMLVGKTGSGKSSTGNTILGSEKFESTIWSTSEASVCQIERAIRDGVTLEVLDSPGLFDFSKSNTEIIALITQSLFLMEPGPSAILYVIRIGRYTEEDFNTYKRIMRLLKNDAKKHMIVLFTHGDQLMKTKVFIEDYLKKATEALTQVIKDCGNRFVVFDNSSENADQVDLLLQTIRKMTAESGVSHYSADIKRLLSEADMNEAEGEGMCECTETPGNREHRQVSDIQVPYTREVLGEKEALIELLTRELEKEREKRAEAEEECRKLRTDSTELKQTDTDSTSCSPEHIDINEANDSITTTDWKLKQLISSLSWREWLLVAAVIVTRPSNSLVHKYDKLKNKKTKKS